MRSLISVEMEILRDLKLDRRRWDQLEKKIQPIVTNPLKKRPSIVEYVGETVDTEASELKKWMTLKASWSNCMRCWEVDEDDCGWEGHYHTPRLNPNLKRRRCRVVNWRGSKDVHVARARRWSFQGLERTILPAPVEFFSCRRKHGIRSHDWILCMMFAKLNAWVICDWLHAESQSWRTLVSKSWFEAWSTIRNIWPTTKRSGPCTMQKVAPC